MVGTKTSGAESDPGSATLQAWKEVHQQLINAVLISKEAISIQKAQRRYWLTEINANLTTEGKLQPTSVWKRPSKRAAKKTPKSSKKRKKSAAETPATKKRKYNKKKTKEQEEEEALTAAAIEAGILESDDNMDDIDMQEDEEDYEKEAARVRPQQHQGKKLRLFVNETAEGTNEDEDEDDEETEEEEDEDDNNDDDDDGNVENDDDDDDDEDHHLPEESFLGSEIEAAHSPSRSPVDGFSSFLPGQYSTSTSMQRPGIMEPMSFRSIPEAEDDLDDDTEEDDY